MTVSEFTNYLYGAIQKDPSLADREIWNINIDMNASKENINIDTDNALVTIENK